MFNKLKEYRPKWTGRDFANYYCRKDRSKLNNFDYRARQVIKAKRQTKKYKNRNSWKNGK